MLHEASFDNVNYSGIKKKKSKFLSKRTMECILGSRFKIDLDLFDKVNSCRPIETQLTTLVIV